MSLRKKEKNRYNSENFLHILVIVGILSTIQLCMALHPSQMYSSTIIHALENVLDRFYSKITPTVFITVASSLIANKYGPKPNELVGDIMRLKSKRSSMAYVIGNQTIHFSRSPRVYNVFIVDSYDSFR